MPQTTRFGDQLSRVMSAAGHKQETLAEAVGVTQPMISKLKSGALQPSQDQIDAIAKACSVSPWALVGGTELAKSYPGDPLVTVAPGPGVKWLGYFASALTGLTDEQREVLFAEAAEVRTVCEKVRTYLYEPSHYTDPVRNPDLRAERVYTIDHAQVSRSDFVVLHARHPSFGAGQELEIATGAGVPVVLLVPKGVRVSRMVLGTYARLHKVEFASALELHGKVDAALASVFADIAARREVVHYSEAHGVDGQTLATRVRKIRTDMKLDSHRVATLIGVSLYAMECLEDGSFPNPSITTLRRLASVLRTSVSELVDGIPLRREDTDPVLRQSLGNLHLAAGELNTPTPLIESLWKQYRATYDAQRLKVAEARTTAVSVTEWLEQIKGGTTTFSVPRQRGLFSDDDE